MPLDIVIKIACITLPFIQHAIFMFIHLDADVSCIRALNADEEITRLEELFLTDNVPAAVQLQQCNCCGWSETQPVCNCDITRMRGSAMQC